ncbi:MAG: hypothetical protein QXO69_01790 [archaeon]
MMDFRRQLAEKINDNVLNKIKNAPKPTKVAEALAVVKQFPAMALTFEEIAELVNISDPGADEKAKASDYDVNEIRKHPEMRVVRTPTETLVRYVGTGQNSLYR